jgi:hypothetical protein
MENRANEAAEITLYKDMKLEELRLRQVLILYMLFQKKTATL